MCHFHLCNVVMHFMLSKLGGYGKKMKMKFITVFMYTMLIFIT